MLYFSLVLTETISKVLVSSTSDSGPLVSDTIAVTPDRPYDIRVEQYLIDMDASSEYVDITIDGQNVGNNEFRLDTFLRSIAPRCHGNFLKTSIFYPSTIKLIIYIKERSNSRSYNTMLFRQ